MRKSILAVVLLLALNNLFAQEGKDPFKKFTSFNEALQQAKKENKLLFVDIYFTGCRPCAQMDREVYPNELVYPALEQNFVSTKFNISNEKVGDTLCLRYMVSGFPTLLILDGDGRLISRESGFHDAGMFLNFLNESLANVKNNKSLKGFSTTYIDDYPDFYKKRYFEKENKENDPEAVLKYIRSQKDWMSEKPALALFYYRFKLSNDMEEYLLKNYNQYIELYGDGLVKSVIQDVLQTKLTTTLSKKVDNKAYESFLAACKPYFPEQDWKECLQVLNMNYYIQIAKDTVAYFKAMAKDPVLYKSYFTVVAPYTSPKFKTEYAPYMAAWADAVIDIESSTQIMQSASIINKLIGNMEGYKRYTQLIIDKMDKYKIEQKSPDRAYFEKILSELNKS